MKAIGFSWTPFNRRSKALSWLSAVCLLLALLLMALAWQWRADAQRLQLSRADEAQARSSKLQARLSASQGSGASDDAVAWAAWRQLLPTSDHRQSLLTDLLALAAGRCGCSERAS